MPKAKKADVVAPVKLNGFAFLAKNDPDKMEKIARKGGQRAHEIGTAHEYNSLQGKYAGKISGASRSGNVELADQLRQEYYELKANGWKPLKKEKVTEKVVDIKTAVAKKGGAGKKTSQNKPSVPTPKPAKKASPAPKKGGKKK